LTVSKRQSTKSIEIVSVELINSTFHRMRHAFDKFHVPGIATHAVAGASTGKA